MRISKWLIAFAALAISACASGDALGPVEKEWPVFDPKMCEPGAAMTRAGKPAESIKIWAQISPVPYLNERLRAVRVCLNANKLVSEEMEVVEYLVNIRPSSPLIKALIAEEYLLSAADWGYYDERVKQDYLKKALEAANRAAQAGDADAHHLMSVIYLSSRLGCITAS